MSRRSRARQRGFSQIGTVLEAAMVMGWFVVLLLGERRLSAAADARRSAEISAQTSASTASSSYCLPVGVGMSDFPGVPSPTITTPSIVPNGTMSVSTAISMVGMLGIGRPRTYGYFVNPLLKIHVKAQSSIDGQVFEGERELSCLERPLDLPNGSIDVFRHPLWIKNLLGY
jgi:hypothetical protein